MKLVQNDPYHQVLSRPLVVLILKNMDSSRLLTSDGTAVKKKRGGKYPVLTPEQEYHANVFGCLQPLLQTVERLGVIPAYLGRFPNSPTFKRQGITLHNWIGYHYSNYLIQALTTYDAVLQLTNAVFFLGLSPRQCKEWTVERNRRVTGPVREAIRAVDVLLKKYREPRNLYVHQGVVSRLADLDRLESLRFLHETSLELGITSKPLIPPIFVKDIYRSKRRELIKALRSETMVIAHKLSTYFDAVEPVYSQMSKAFAATGTT